MQSLFWLCPRWVCAAVHKLKQSGYEWVQAGGVQVTGTLWRWLHKHHYPKKTFECFSLSSSPADAVSLFMYGYILLYLWVCVLKLSVCHEGLVPISWSTDVIYVQNIYSTYCQFCGRGQSGHKLFPSVPVLQAQHVKSQEWKRCKRPFDKLTTAAKSEFFSSMNTNKCVVKTKSLQSHSFWNRWRHTARPHRPPAECVPG